MTQWQPTAQHSAGSDDGESVDNQSVSARGRGMVVPRCAVIDLAVCNSGEDSLSVLTAGGEVLMLDMAMQHEREEKLVDEIVGHSDEPVR